MDALILAAGLGSRIRAVEPCKPLTCLHGVSLLEIGVRQLALTGATNVVVATGYQADMIEQALPAMARQAGIAVTSRRVEDYRQANGYSVLAGAQGFSSEFLLVMADHVFSRAVLEALVAGPEASDGAILAIDRRIDSPLVDPEDATWVTTGTDGRIEQIGKALTTYDAVDCGAFRAGPALLDAIHAAIGSGKPGSLSDGMQGLADAGRAGTVDIGDAWWIDVDDAQALQQAQQEVREHLPEIFARQGVKS